MNPWEQPEKKTNPVVHQPTQEDLDAVEAAKTPEAPKEIVTEPAQVPVTELLPEEEDITEEIVQEQPEEPSEDSQIMDRVAFRNNPPKEYGMYLGNCTKSGKPMWFHGGKKFFLKDAPKGLKLEPISAKS